MESHIDQQNKIQDIKADVSRELKLFTNPLKGQEQKTLAELEVAILTALRRENGELISSYGYRLLRNVGHGNIYIVGENSKGQYSLLRVFAHSEKWEVLTDVSWGPVANVLDHMMANFVPQ